jgi:septal ring factor EnvC (AmiA/AmiB activator)
MWMKISLVLLALLVSSSLASAWYYKYSQDIIMTLQANNAKLEVAINTQKETIASMKESFERQAAALTDLSAANQALNNEKDALSTKLMKHDLEELSRKKPGLIERRINSGTKKLFSDFTDLSTQ